MMKSKKLRLGRLRNWPCGGLWRIYYLGYLCYFGGIYYLGHLYYLGCIRGRCRDRGLGGRSGHWFVSYCSRHIVDGRLTEPDTDRMELTEIWIHQVGITLTDVVDGLGHPRCSVIIRGAQHATPIDVAEQLITSLCENLLFWHSHLPVFHLNG